jgi:DNA polymerase-3 subunit alpha
MGFAGYFLIVADFIQWAKGQGIPVGPGRGSGAGSVAAWALTITDVDPIRFNLLFERFLNPERVSMPDFDIDFCQEGRDGSSTMCAGIRRRPRRADHHIRQAAGARRGARRRPRAGPAVRPGEPRRRADPQQSPAKPVTLQQAMDGEPRLQACATRTRASPVCWRSRCRSRGCIATPHARRRRGDRRPAAGRAGAAVSKIPKSDFLVTQYSMKHVEQAGPGEIRLPRPDHADDPGSRRGFLQTRHRPSI